MSNQMNQIETPEEKKKGNFWSLMSLICFVSRFIVNIVIILVFVCILYFLKKNSYIKNIPYKE